MKMARQTKLELFGKKTFHFSASDGVASALLSAPGSTNKPDTIEPIEPMGFPPAAFSPDDTAPVS